MDINHPTVFRRVILFRITDERNLCGDTIENFPAKIFATVLPFFSICDTMGT